MHALHANPVGYTPDRCFSAAKEEQVVTLLRALGIEEVEYHLDGGGDSGDTSLERVLYIDGHEETHLPDLPISFNPRGEVQTLPHYLDNLASNLPEGDWINNDGGSGEVFIRPMADDEDWFECNMTFHDEDDYEGDDFEEGEGGFDDADEPPALGPEHGETVTGAKEDAR